MSVCICCDCVLRMHKLFLHRLQILKILSERFRKDEISYTFFVFIFSLMKIVSFPVSSLAGVKFI